MIEDVLTLINKHNPRALYTVEAIKYVNKEIFHRSEEERRYRWLSNRGKRMGK